MCRIEMLQPAVGPPVEEATVDIVFVHGLNGSPQRTWCNKERSIVWPTDLLPKEFPSARIFMYDHAALKDNSSQESESTSDREYQALSYVWGDKSQVSADFDGFLHGLDASREKHQPPIVFVAHSLGGLILRDALNREWRDRKLRLLDQIRWLCFLGTPDFKTDDEWRTFFRYTARTEGGHPAIDPSHLSRWRSINQDFQTWIQSTKTKKTGVEVSCFYEVLAIEGNGVLAPKEASVLPGCDAHPFLKDHFTFPQSENSIDSVYRTICDQLRARMRDPATLSDSYRSFEVASTRRSSSSDGREKALDALSTPEDIKDPTKKALALEDRGRVEAAREALTILVEKLLKKTLDDASTIDWIVFFCYDKLACVLRKCGRFHEAESRCREVLEVKRRVLGRTDPATLDTAGNLALILRSQGRFEEAIQMLTDNLEPAPQYSEQPIVQIKLFSILSKIYKDIGYLDLAELLARDVLIASIRYFGVEHTFTLTRASDLAVVLARKRKYDFAEELSTRVLYLLERMIGKDHRYSLRASQRLAFVLLLQGKLSNAARIYERTRLLQQEQLGFNHQNTLASTCGLGTALVRQGKIRDGKVYLQGALRGQLSLLGADHPDTLWTAHVLRHLNDLNTQGRSLATPEKGSPLDDFLRRPSRPQDLSSMFSEISCIYPPALMDSSDVWNFKLRFAAFQGNRDGVIEALKHGAQLNAVGGIYGTALQAACYAGKTEIVDELLTREGIDVNVQGGLFGTPLRAASFSGHAAIVSRLLDNKDSRAMPNITDSVRGSALGAALVADATDVVEALLRGGANKYTNDDIYGTALHEAAMNGQARMVEIFLDEGANPDIRAGLFGTAIEASAWGGNTTTISLLLGRGASLDGRYEGRNAVFLASARGHQEALKLLQQKIKELKERSGRVLHRDNSDAALVVEDTATPLASTAGKTSPGMEAKMDVAPGSVQSGRPKREHARTLKRYSRRLALRFRR